MLAHLKTSWEFLRIETLAGHWWERMASKVFDCWSKVILYKITLKCNTRNKFIDRKDIYIAVTSYFVARAHKAVWSQRAFEPSVPSYFVQLSEIKCKRRSRDCQFSFTICCLETTWSFPMTLIMPILCRDDTENNHLVLYWAILYKEDRW